MNDTMLQEYLPFLIPLIVALLGMQFIGPILYFLLGKEDA